MVPNVGLNKNLVGSGGLRHEHIKVGLKSKNALIDN